MIIETIRKNLYYKKRENECKNCIKGDCIFNKNSHIQIIEKKVEVLDCEISTALSRLERVYEDGFTLEELKEMPSYEVKNENGKWTVFQKQCYYGGCSFDPKEFNDEYSAYKHSAILELFYKINKKEHKMKGATTILAEVNRDCPDYYECSGMDY